MNYSFKEKNNIIKFKKNFELQKIKEQEFDEKIKDYEYRINKLKRKKSCCIGYQTKNINSISKIACKIFIETSTDDILSLIFKELYKVDEQIHCLINNKSNIINILYCTNKKFRRIIYDIFNIIKIGYGCYKSKNISYIRNVFIKKNSLNKFEDKELEQLLYIAFTKNTRSLIHLFVRSNKLEIINYLVSKFDTLNINVPTTMDYWLFDYLKKKLININIK